MEAAQRTAWLVERIDELPTLPTVVYELTKVINDPMSSTKEVEKIMLNDQSLTVKVLKLVNSAYYAIPGGVSSLARAIAYIGFDTINQLVISASIIDALKTTSANFNSAEFWKHSIGVAIAAETIAKHIRHPVPADLFTCGLVHDIGKMALVLIDPETYAKIAETAKAKNMSTFEAETDMKFMHHTEIGNLLAKKWMLPAPIRASVMYHHQLNPIGRGGASAEINRMIDIVMLANLLVHALKFGSSGHSKVLGAPLELMERLTLKQDAGFKTLLESIKSNLVKASDFIRIIGGQQ